MTRLEKQIAKKQEELEFLKKYSSEKLAVFNSQYPQIAKILKSYGIRQLSTENCFLDFTPIEREPIFRMYLEFKEHKLSSRQIKNLEKKLRAIAPMPISPISRTSIHFCYHD